MQATEFRQFVDMVRHEPRSPDGRRDLCTTSISLRAETIDENDRSVDVVLATEQAVTVFDWNSFRTIDEVLMMSGMEIANHIPLLDNHARSNDSVFGSFSNFRQEGNQLIAKMTFVNLLAEPTLRNDPEALRIERAWAKVKQNHNRNVSVGYRVLESIDIPAGETRRIAGRSFRAGDRSLRVAVRWVVREGSLTPVGADASATTRNLYEGNHSMNLRLRNFLQSLGLRADQTEAEAWDFYRSLNGDNRNQANGLIDVRTDMLPPDIRAGLGQPTGGNGGQQLGAHLGGHQIQQVGQTQPAQQGQLNPDLMRQANPLQHHVVPSAPMQPAAQPGFSQPGHQQSVLQQPIQQQPVGQPLPGRQDTSVGIDQSQGQMISGQSMVPGTAPLQDPYQAVANQFANRNDNYMPVGRDVNAIVNQALDAENQRVRRIHELFGSDEPELRERAILERWTPERASEELLPRIRRRNSDPAGFEGFQGGIHVRGSADVNQDVLSMALLMREAPQLIENDSLLSQRARLIGLPRVLTADINDDAKQRSLEMANRFRQHSLLDICELALRMNPQTSQRVPHDREEMIRTAFSSGAVNDLFTTNIHARSFVAYEDAPDSTMGWCSEVENFNFMPHEAVANGKIGALTKHARGGKADHVDGEALMEPYRIGRYSGQATIDEMDILDNRFRGSSQLFSAEEMGQSAKQLRPNLVFGSIHANANLTHSGRALFNATDGNLITGGPLSIASLEAAEIALGERRDRDRPLNLTLDFLIVPRQLKFKAKQILESAVRKGDTDEGEKNPISDENVEIRMDSRLGPNGCTDPDTDLKHQGTATNFITASRPGAGGARTIQVAYRQGTNRAPRVRSTVLSEGGCWGINIDINMDIGVKALDHKGINFHTGA